MRIRLHRQRCKMLLPLLCLLLALDLTVTAGMSANATTLDLTFGSGQRVVVSGEAEQGREAEYYQQQYHSPAKAKRAAVQVARRISDEGIVLLKNDGLLPLSPQTPVVPLGLRFVQPYYGGTGSSAISTAKGDVISPAEGLREAFSHVSEAAIHLQQGLSEQVESLCCTKPVSHPLPAHFLYELPGAALLPLAEECVHSVALVYIGRQAGEQTDACSTPYDDGTPHMLALTKAEHELIRFASEHCQDVVVILCSASAMQIPELAEDERISAIVWIGGAGSTGYASLAGILTGQVNPSGRLPVTFSSDFTQDSSYPNHDDGSDRFTYANVTATQITNQDMLPDSPVAFHEYEEGVYVGYRYYETACALGYLADLGNRPEKVTYPFGHGLSYTTFRQRITKLDCDGRQIAVTVSVTNTGTVPGKTVIQLYAERPYAESDQKLRIEKSAVDLIQFCKTDMLAPAETAQFTLHFPLELLASYSSNTVNLDSSIGGYVLTEGNYRLSVRENAHTVIDAVLLPMNEPLFYHNFESFRGSQPPLANPSTVIHAPYDDSLLTPATEASNRFEAMERYARGDTSHMVLLSRANWAATQPTAPTQEDRFASNEVCAALRSDDVTLPHPPESETLLPPISGAHNGVVLADLRGYAYHDLLWEMLLDQLDFSQTDALIQTLLHGGYGTAALPTIGLPATRSYDGPQGLTLADISGKNWLQDMCGYPGVPLMAATWDPDLMYDFGASVGQEALTSGIHGWYAPGLNILRSPFCGRTSEYFSEDPVLSGFLGAKVLSGAGDNGLVCAVKHFPLMETENHRSPNTCNWMSEQTLREIYMKPFELALRSSKKTVLYYDEEKPNELSSLTLQAGNFIMVSDSAVGSLWSAANRLLLTDVVRGEWHFEGAIITDMHQSANSAIIDRILAAGCDVFMTSSNDPAITVSSFQSPSIQSHIRRAVKNLSYAFVNSSLTQHMSPASVVEYHLSPWQAGLLIVHFAVGLICLLGLFLCFDWKPH